MPFSQYTTLYTEHRADIERLAPEALNAVREQAYASLLTAGKVDRRLAEALAPDYGINLGRHTWPADVAQLFKCDLPRVSTLLGAVVNDVFVPGRRMEQGLPEGVVVCRLSQAPAELLAMYYSTVAPLADPAVALNSLLVQDGVLVHVARGVHLKHPVQIVNYLNAPLDMLASRRLLIVMEPDSSAQIVLCDHTDTASDHRYAVSQVTEAILAQGASLEVADLEEASPATSRIASFYASQATGSELRTNVATLMGGTTLNTWHIDINGSHCSAHLSGMAIGTDSMYSSNVTEVLHHAPRSQSNQIFKYILDDQSRGSFDGAIRVDEGADFTSAYQSNRNLLASADARMHTKPQLEIYCDEVKCSHGATTGQLDEQALFYMRQRGIPLDQARVMLMQAFMAEVVDTVRIDGLRDRLRHLVDRRLSSDPRALCADCSSSPED